MKNDPRKSETAERRRMRLEREQAVAALERMQEAPAEGILHTADARALDGVARRKGKRPLKPPPGKIPARMATAAELALAKDQRLGIVGGAFRLGTADE